MSISETPDTDRAAAIEMASALTISVSTGGIQRPVISTLHSRQSRMRPWSSMRRRLLGMGARPLLYIQRLFTNFSTSFVSACSRPTEVAP